MDDKTIWFQFVARLDYNQIKILIYLEIIEEEDKYKKNYIYIFKILKTFLQFSAVTWRDHVF